MPSVEGIIPRKVLDCFRYLKRRFTHSIFFEPKKILSYVSDYMPELMVEKRILKVALEAGVYKQLLDDSGKIIELNIEKTKFTLVNDYGLSEKWAGEAVDWLVKAFGTTQSKDTVEVKVATTTSVAPPKEKKTNPVTASTTTTSNKTIGRDNKGDYTYVGQTDAKGIPNGPGELTYSSGEKFIGTFKNGRLSGKGKWLTSYGQTFEGMFENGKQVECDGVLTERNGAVYKGHFRRGLRMGRLTIPTEEVDISGVWKDAARCVHVHTPDDIINILKSIFYYSVADGYSQLDDSSVVKSSRILNNVLSGRILSEGERAMGGNFTVGYPSMTNVNVNGELELRRCQITSCSPKNAQDVVLKLEDKGDWLLVTNVSEMPLVATFTVSSLECRRIPHDSTDSFEILANPNASSKLSLAVKVDFDTFGYMSITNNSDFDISVRHTIGSQGMYLRQDDYVTIGEGIQILKVIKGGKVANDWDNWDWD